MVLLKKQTLFPSSPGPQSERLIFDWCALCMAIHHHEQWIPPNVGRTRMRGKVWIIQPSHWLLDIWKLTSLSLFDSVQLLSHVWLFATPWSAAHQASLSIANSPSLLKFMSIKLVMPSNHLILCHPLLLLPSIFPASGSFQMNRFFTSGDQTIGVSASVSVLPMNIQDWFPSGWTGWISLQSKGLSRVFSNTTVQKH